MRRNVVDRGTIGSAATAQPIDPPLPGTHSPIDRAPPARSIKVAQRWAAQMVGPLLADRRGVLAPVVAVFMPVALGAAGLAVDMSNSYVEQNRLQTAVDEASLAAVQLLPDVEAARAAAVASFDKQYNPGPRDLERDTREAIEPGDIAFGRWDPATRKVTPVDPGDSPPNTIAITLDRLAADGRGLDTWFLAAVGIKQLDRRARAVASAEGGESAGTCIIALEPTAGKAVHTQGAARLVADGCRIQVNSTAVDAIEVTGNAPMGGISAAEICVVGGAKNSGRMSPAPQLGCVPVADPFADFTPPAIGTCSHFGFTHTGGSTTLQPGVYCGGITIDKPGNITMAPGIYVIKDGAFLADLGDEKNGKIKIDAAGVALQLVGADARIDIDGNVEMNHKAPKSGPLAGFAIYQQQPTVPAKRTSRMGQGNSKTRVEGTIYLPDQHLTWGGTPSTTLPPWTLLIARTLYVFGTADLRIGKDFDASDIPPPKEFNEKKKARLVN